MKSARPVPTFASVVSEEMATGGEGEGGSKGRGARVGRGRFPGGSEGGHEAGHRHVCEAITRIGERSLALSTGTIRFVLRKTFANRNVCGGPPRTDGGALWESFFFVLLIFVVVVVFVLVRFDVI